MASCLLRAEQIGDRATMTLGGVLVEVEARFASLAQSRVVQLSDVVRLRASDLGSDDVAKAAKLSAEEVQEALKKELEKDYVSKYKNAKPENYEENLEKTLSEDNLGKAMIYLGKDGKLTAICKEYASVGAGEFSVVLTLK